MRWYPAGIRFGVVGLGTLLAALVGPPTSAADTSGWVYFDNSKAPFTFVDGKNVSLQGWRDAAGQCQGSLTLNHDAGTPPISALEIAANPTTCEQIVIVGHTDPAVPVTPPKGIASPVQSTGILHDSDSPDVLQQHGYFYTYWHDPVWIIVNYVEDEATWNYSSPFIRQIVAYWDDLGYETIPYRWYQDSHSGPTLTVDYNDYWATIVSRAQFHNTSFCGGTWTTYQPNTLKIYGDGHDSGTVNTWAWGCSTNLLSHGSTLY